MTATNSGQHYETVAVMTSGETFVLIHDRLETLAGLGRGFPRPLVTVCR